MLLAALTLFVAFSPHANALRHATFDAYQRIFPLQRDGARVVVVLIDENSIAGVGQWPWPRTRLAELMDRIAEQKPLAVGLDLFFAEADRFSPATIAQELPLMPAVVARALDEMPTNDNQFAQSLRGAPVVLGIGLDREPDPRFLDPPRAAPVRSRDQALAGLATYKGYIGNIRELDQAATGRGFMNSGAQDQVVRAAPLLANVNGAIVPSLALETVRVAADAGISVEPLRGGLLRLAFDPVDTRLQPDGHAWIRFSRHQPDVAFPALSFLDRSAHPETLKDKLVLVGIGGLGVMDYKTTPLGEFVPGVFVHRQIMENLLSGISLVRYGHAELYEALALLACGLLLIALVPRLSALRGINVAVGLVLLLVAASVGAFLLDGALFDPSWPALGTGAVFASIVVGTLSEADRQRRLLREQAARVAGEIDAARRIQMGLLPDPEETLGAQPAFELAAALEPARTVGGDFYDCFMADARRLFFVVADVSGKGLPAALFMASAKSHLKSAALRGGSVGEVLSRAQEEIGHENPEQLFVTAFAASLDVQTGELEYANAGHEPPFAMARDGAIDRIGLSGGPPLCVIEEFAYPTDRRRLAAGELVVVFTDGVTEAMDPSRAFYGLERLREVLAGMPREARASDVARTVREDVLGFAAGAEAADDVTLMVLRWKGVPSGR